MPRTEKHLIQIQLSAPEKRWLKSLAAGQGMTFRQAVLAALAAWEQKLAKKSPAATKPDKASATQSSTRAKTTAPASTSAPATDSQAWLQRAAKLDWTKCPEVEVMAGKNRRLWVLTGTLAPLAEVLQTVADGHRVEEVAEVFDIDLPRLKKVLKFASWKATSR
jgi:hypothetical protein